MLSSKCVQRFSTIFFISSSRCHLWLARVCSEEEVKKRKIPAKNNCKLYAHLIGGRKSHITLMYLIFYRCCRQNYVIAIQPLPLLPPNQWLELTFCNSNICNDDNRSQIGKCMRTTPKKMLWYRFLNKILIIINWVDFDRVWTSIPNVF